MIQVPGYTILRELGRGGMAVVFLARQDRLGRDVALKIMQPQALASDDFTARFIKEGHIIARLQHPQIVTIYDLDIVDGLHYFSMEYLPQGTLSERIQRGLSPQEAIEITKRVAQALAFAHDQRVIHRDIKPQNILFRADGTPVLTDFGIARAAGVEATHLTNIGMVVGSPRYMSPEQSMSEPIDARSDLYSLGVVLYEMLTGEPPYKANDVISLAMAHRTAPIPILSPKLAAYQPILERLLAKYPEDRFDSARDLIGALETFQTGDWSLPAHEGGGTQVIARDRAPGRADRSYPSGSRPAAQSRRETAGKPPGPPNKKLWIALAVTLVVLSIAAGLYLAWDRFAKDPIADLAEALALPPAPADRPQIADRYERLALENLQTGDLDRSLELVRLALSRDPGDVRLKALQARVVDRIEAEKRLAAAERERAAGAYDRSLTLIEEGLALAPGHPKLGALRERVLAELSQQKAAQADKLLQDAQAAYGRGDLSRSMQLTVDALVLAPENPEIKALEAELQQRLDQQRALRELLARSSALVEEGRFEEALDGIEKALTANPEEPELLELKARISREIERREARAAAAKADELEQAAAGALEKGAFDDSLALIAEGLALVPGHPGLTALRGRVLAGRETRDAAEAAQLLVQAQAALDRDDLDTGLRLSQEGLRLDPDSTRLAALKTEVTARMAEREEVADVRVEVSDLIDRRQFSEARNLIEKTATTPSKRAALADLSEEIKAQIAREAADKAAALAAQAQSLADQGRFEDALALVADALKLDPEDAALTALRARIQEQAGRARADALQGQARDALAAGKLTLALELTEKGLAQRPGDAGLLALEATIRGRIEEQRTVGEVVARVRGMREEKRFEEGIEALEVALALYPDNASLLALRKEIDEARKQAAIAELLPEMVPVRGGCFRMGSPESEPNREPDEQAHKVCLEDFELAKYETRVRDFGRFVEAAGFETDAERATGGVAGCWTFDRAAEEPWGYHAWANWRLPNQDTRADPEEPVTCVSKYDAQAYIAWLNKATGQTFRLPTEAEWEYGARAATLTARYWGDAADGTACRNANVADRGHDWNDGFPCDDGYRWIAPVGRFLPNPWGLHDMLGNVSEWTCSEYVQAYGGAEAVCAPPESVAPMVLRGGSWNSEPSILRSAFRDRNYPEARYSSIGFRLARDKPARGGRDPAPGGASP